MRPRRPGGVPTVLYETQRSPSQTQNFVFVSSTDADEILSKILRKAILNFQVDGTGRGCPSPGKEPSRSHGSHLKHA
jgi:hypothetical protein